jgi:hypothetical protein
MRLMYSYMPKATAVKKRTWCCGARPEPWGSGRWPCRSHKLAGWRNHTTGLPLMGQIGSGPFSRAAGQITRNSERLRS